MLSKPKELLTCHPRTGFLSFDRRRTIDYRLSDVMDAILRIHFFTLYIHWPIDKKCTEEDKQETNDLNNYNKSGFLKLRFIFSKFHVVRIVFFFFVGFKKQKCVHSFIPRTNWAKLFTKESFFLLKKTSIVLIDFSPSCTDVN